MFLKFKRGRTMSEKKKEKRFRFEEETGGSGGADTEPAKRSYTPTAPLDRGESAGDKYVLVWHSSIELDSRIYFPGDKIGEDVFKKMPDFLKPHWWNIGKELPPHIFNKMTGNLQKNFKLKT